MGNLETAEALNEALAGTDLTLRVHLKLETGMGRTGFRAFGSWKALPAATAVRLPRLEAEGVFTHFCVSDAGEGVRDFTEEQYRRFLAAVEAIETRSGRKFALRHCANSGAMHAFPGTYLDMVRPGVSLYGMYPGPVRDNIPLRPAMTLKTRVAYVERHEPGDTISYGRTFTADRPMEIAVLPIGYADGLHRVLSNRMSFWLGGRRVPQVGRICMDMCMADVTGLGVRPGDVAEVFGPHIQVDEVADLAGTIHYEITCAVSPRVPRVYTDPEGDPL